MSTYALDAVFRPKSVAVVGASPRERSVGRAVVRNLREAGFAGPVGLVNPKYRQIEIQGRPVQLGGDQHPHQHPHDAPDHGHHRELYDYLVVIGIADALHAHHSSA